LKNKEKSMKDILMGVSFCAVLCAIAFSHQSPQQPIAVADNTVSDECKEEIRQVYGLGAYQVIGEIDCK
jgi:hypothetical protein